MSKPNTTQAKRAKELARAERKQEKIARRAETRERKAKAEPRDGEVDPDIAGIVPGPQAPPPIGGIIRN